MTSFSIPSPDRTKLSYTMPMTPSELDLQEESSISPPRISSQQGSSSVFSNNCGQYRITRQTFHAFLEKTEFIPHQPSHFSDFKKNIAQLFCNWHEAAEPRFKPILRLAITSIYQNCAELEDERQSFIEHLAQFLDADRAILLFIAAQQNYFSLIPMILACGLIDINTRDRFHNTPLHDAIFHKSHRSIRLLLDHGALTDIKNFEGKTARDYLSAPEFQDLFQEYFYE